MPQVLVTGVEDTGAPKLRFTRGTTAWQGFLIWLDESEKEKERLSKLPYLWLEREEYPYFYEWFCTWLPTVSTTTTP